MKCWFRDTCRVILHEPSVRDGITTFTEREVLHDLPCCLQVSRSPAGATDSGGVKVTQTARLYSVPGLLIPPGATVEVHGERYRRCGLAEVGPLAAVYELELEEMA